MPSTWRRRVGENGAIPLRTSPTLQARGVTVWFPRCCAEGGDGSFVDGSDRGLSCGAASTFLIRGDQMQPSRQGYITALS